MELPILKTSRSIWLSFQFLLVYTQFLPPKLSFNIHQRLILNYLTEQTPVPDPLFITLFFLSPLSLTTNKTGLFFFYLFFFLLDSPFSFAERIMYNRYCWNDRSTKELIGGSCGKKIIGFNIYKTGGGEVCHPA